jgi:hypothetical protein
MTIYGYIDESGTMARDQVFAICLVLCSGRNKADRFHYKVAQALRPEHNDKPKILTATDLHFCKMSEQFIEKTASVLKHESIQAFVSYRYHDSETENFSGMIWHYTAMARQVIYQALEQNEQEIEIMLGSMGQKKKFENSLCSEIASVTDLFSKRNRGAFRKVSCSIASANIKGIQLADFYAGSTRRMILALDGNQEPENSSPFEHLEKQIIHDWAW